MFFGVSGSTKAVGSESNMCSGGNLDDQQIAAVDNPNLISGSLKWIPD